MSISNICPEDGMLSISNICSEDGIVKILVSLRKDKFWFSLMIVSLSTIVVEKFIWFDKESLFDFSLESLAFCKLRKSYT